MSMSVSIVGIDGIVLATDSLRSNPVHGGFRHEAGQKLWQLGLSTGLITVGGHGFYAYDLIRDFESKIEKDAIFEDVKGKFPVYVKESYEKHIRKEPDRTDDSNIMIFVLAGYTSRNEPQIIQLDSAEPDLLFAGKAVDPLHVLSWDVLHDYWLTEIGLYKANCQSWNVGILTKVAVFLIHETANHSQMVGGNISVAIITKNKGFTFVSDEIIKNLRKDIDTIKVGENVKHWLESTTS